MELVRTFPYTRMIIFFFFALVNYNRAIYDPQPAHCDNVFNSTEGQLERGVSFNSKETFVVNY